MKPSTIGTTVLAAALAMASGAAMAQGYPQQQGQQNYPQQQGNYPQQGQPGPGYQQGDRGRDGWDAPPPDFRTDISRQGFRDGLGAARQDFESHRQPNAGYRSEYRHPPVSRVARNEYRDSFRRGYDIGMRHMMERRDDHRGYPPPPSGYQPR